MRRNREPHPEKETKQRKQRRMKIPKRIQNLYKARWEHHAFCCKAWRERKKAKTGSSKDSNFRKRHRLYMRRWRKHESKIKQKARTAVRSALISGRLLKLPCQKCGKPAEAHHPNYRKPLEVIWLCSIHHQEIHRRRNFGVNLWILAAAKRQKRSALFS